MVVKLLAFGAAALVAMGMGAAALLFWSDSRPIQPSRATSALARELEQRARESRNTAEVGWAVTKATSAHRALVVEIEAERPDDAKRIATEIVRPMEERGYEEVLVYVRHPDPTRDPTVRRVQWTPGGGYVESRFVDR